MSLHLAVVLRAPFGRDLCGASLEIRVSTFLSLHRRREGVAVAETTRELGALERNSALPALLTLRLFGSRGSTSRRGLARATQRAGTRGVQSGSNCWIAVPGKGL